MAYFLPFRPFMLRTLGFSAPNPPGKSFHFPGNPLVHFRATQAAFPHACRAFTRWPRSTTDHPQNAPRIRSPAFKHIRIEKPFFSRSVSGKRVKSFALLLTSPAPGFGYPFRGGFSWPPDPWEPFSAPNALRLRSSELFSFRTIGRPLSRRLLPFLRFLVKPFGPHTGASTVCSRPESCAPLRTRGFNSGRNHVLS
jgi:hypothetical protein